MRASRCTAALLLLSACSPGMFGSGVDPTVANRPGYRHINAACVNLDVSGRALDTKTFRSIVKCLDSSGGLEPLERLTTSLPDSELEPLLATVNKYWLSKPKKVFEVERTYDDMLAKGLLDPAFRNIGLALENRDFWISLIASLRGAYFAKGQDLKKGNPLILKLLERAGSRLTSDHARAGLEAGITISGSPAFASIQTRFRGPSPGGRSIRQITDPFLEYVKPTADPKHVEAGKVLLSKFVSGEMFTVLDEVIGGPDRLTDTVPRLSSAFRVLMRNKSETLDGLTSLFHYLHVPVPCLGGSKVLFDADMHVIKAVYDRPSSQAGDFIRRENTLDLMTLGPLCKYPTALGQYYPYLYQIADTNTAGALAELLDSFYRIEGAGNDPFSQHPMATLIVNILADTGSSQGPAPENTVGVKRLFPLLSELSDRGAWDDLLLLVSLLKVGDRPDFNAAVSWLLEPDASLGGKSMFDVVFDVFSKEDPAILEGLIRSLSKFTDSDQPVFLPVLSHFRDSYYINDAHPFVDLFGEILRDASANEAFYNALFKVSDKQDFSDTIKLFSEMGKDGRLTELAQVLVTLFHRFGREGQEKIATVPAIPAFHSRAAHHLSKRDLTEFPILPVDVDGYGDCGKLDLRFDISATSSSQFPAQWDAYLGCVNTDGAKPAYKAALSLLNTEKNESGQTYFTQLVTHVRGLDLSAAAQGYAIDSFGSAFDDGRVGRLLSVAPFFTSREVRGSDDDPGDRGTVAKPLVSIIAPIVDQARASLRRPQEWLAQVLERPDLPALIKHSDFISNAQATPHEQPLEPPFDHLRIERWIKNKECQLLNGPDAARVLAAETERVKSDYENEATTWDLVPSQGGRLVVREGWGFGEFKAFLEPLFKRYAAPSESLPGRPVLSAAFQTLKYFTLPEGGRVNRYQHYYPHEFQRWLQDHSKDEKLITFFYPKGGQDPDSGYEETPRVRYVSSLDRLETLIITADFTAPILGVNEGYRFLELFAKSWGDEDPSVWPDEIKREYPDPRHRPPTLAESAQALKQLLVTFKSLLGLPKLPNCQQTADPNDPPDVQRAETTDPQGNPITGPIDVLPHQEDLKRRLFNLYQVSSVIDDMIPKRRPDGTEDPGLKVLRDLFFELFYSTPERSRTYREDCDKRYTSGPNRGKWKENVCANNLWVIMRVARAGLIHQTARQLWKIRDDDPSIDTVLSSLLAAVTPGGELPAPGSPPPTSGDLNPELLRVLHMLLRKDPHRKLLWDVTEQVFKTIDSSNPDDRASLKQTGYYGLALLGPNKLLEPALRSAAPLLENHYAYLAKHASIVGDLLDSKDAARLTKVLYADPQPAERARLFSVAIDALGKPYLLQDLLAVAEAVDSTPDTSRQWKLFRSRLDTVRDLPAYQAIDLSDFKGPILKFLEEDTLDPAELELSRKVKTDLIARLRGGDLDQVLLLARNRPDEFYQLLKVTGDSVDNGDFMYFLKVIRGNLSETLR